MTGRLMLFLLTCAATVSAQANLRSTMLDGRLRVRALFEDRGACEATTRVELIASSGFTFAENSLNRQCVADFFSVPAGNYRVRVTGTDVASSGESQVALSPGMSEDVEVQAKHSARADEAQNYAVSAFVSVGELGTPSAAEKEFKKANQLISKEQWAKAIERLRKAIAIYPQYAAAYNNLGAVYSRMGDMAQAREALQNAITFNDHMALAYVNLARVSFAVKDFSGVETFVTKALGFAAPDGGELTLLGYAQLADRHFDETIRTAAQAHHSQLGHHAFLHVLAAKADELQGKGPESAMELQEFLSEEPTGHRADQVRHVLEQYQASGAAR